MNYLEELFKLPNSIKLKVKSKYINANGVASPLRATSDMAYSILYTHKTISSRFGLPEIYLYLHRL